MSSVGWTHYFFPPTRYLHIEKPQITIRTPVEFVLIRYKSIAVPDRSRRTLLIKSLVKKALFNIFITENVKKTHSMMFLNPMRIRMERSKRFSRSGSLIQSSVNYKQSKLLISFLKICDFQNYIMGS